MEAEERMQELRTHLFELESQINGSLAELRSTLTQYEDAQAALLRKVRAARVRFYTEEQTAKRMQVSLDTLQRLRQRHERKPGGWPHLRLGSLVRYTDEHLQQIAVILDQRKPRKVAEQRAS